MRFRRLILLSILLFALSFGWAGGTDYITGLLPALPSSQRITTHLASSWERTYRMIALKSAVNEKLNKTNYITIQYIPLAMQQSIIAVEDNRFYRHYGFDIEGILRAMLVNMQAGGFSEGGSTITQQLIKNLFLTQEKTYGRKAEEFILAMNMELRYSKEEILEMYLNTIYFGSGAYGIGDAAKIYFDKAPVNLTLAECSLLAGLPTAPSLNSPYVDFNAAKQRQAIVLSAMARQGYIGTQTAEEARLTPIKLAK
ncbi:transglycosylase domain-containing protein [Pelosinus baikalensis]|uniref:Transglycosylase domain-containing protein n=1 Tax=Pelosinus baikalensis TaxID=2892015 RepID=A0ABS8HX23_9FIRM|nr:transglycosylase domain-containing protein [Pelosinus baikalensis]MCC5466697.1 transglycosylase domain-containing protein [Pelosinus baikalensis]